MDQDDDKGYHYKLTAMKTEVEWKERKRDKETIKKRKNGKKNSPVDNRGGKRDRWD